MCKLHIIYHEFLAEENLGKFGESLVVHQILPFKFQQCLVIYIKKANKQKFTKVLLPINSHYTISPKVGVAHLLYIIPYLTALLELHAYTSKRNSLCPCALNA